MADTRIQTEVHGSWHQRKLLVDGETVSRVSVPDHRIRILGTEIRMGGIGGVRTERKHRMKGYSRRLLEGTVEYMTELGQDVSMLWGISDFYCKYGFGPCLVEHCTRVATRDAEKLSADDADRLTSRPLEESDLDFVLRLYEADNRRRSCALIRDPERFRGFRKGSSYHVDAAGAILEEDGNPMAYVVCDDSKTEVKAIEVNAVSADVFGGVLAELTRLAVERRCGHIELHMAVDHPFARFVRRAGCRVQSEYPRMGNGMMRILNQGSLLRKLRPAMEEQLALSEFRMSRVQLVLDTDLGTSELDLNAGGTKATFDGHVSLRQDQLMQIVAGYRRADDVLLDDNVAGSEGVERLLDALFGGQRPYVWLADRF